MSKLLALDQASKTTGWAIFEGKNLVKWGKIELTNDDIGIRLMQLRMEVEKLLKEYLITSIAFEDIQLQDSVGNNVQTFKVLAEVFGIIQELAVENRLPYSVVPSSSWKSSLGIKGKDRPAQKKAAAELVKTTFGVDDIQDVSDAICIGAHVLKIIPEKKVSVETGFDWS